MRRLNVMKIQLLIALLLCLTTDGTFAAEPKPLSREAAPIATKILIYVRSTKSTQPVAPTPESVRKHFEKLITVGPLYSFQFGRECPGMLQFRDNYKEAIAVRGAIVAVVDVLYSNGDRISACISKSADDYYVNNRILRRGTLDYKFAQYVQEIMEPSLRFRELNVEVIKESQPEIQKKGDGPPP